LLLSGIGFVMTLSSNSIRTMLIGIVVGPTGLMIPHAPRAVRLSAPPSCLERSSDLASLRVV
jgi:hypothetical protein